MQEMGVPFRIDQIAFFMFMKSRESVGRTSRSFVDFVRSPRSPGRSAFSFRIRISAELNTSRISSLCGDVGSGSRSMNTTLKMREKEMWQARALALERPPLREKQPELKGLDFMEPRVRNCQLRVLGWQ
jgi:hypothetical protein